MLCNEPSRDLENFLLRPRAGVDLRAFAASPHAIFQTADAHSSIHSEKEKEQTQGGRESFTSQRTLKSLLRRRDEVVAACPHPALQDLLSRQLVVSVEVGQPILGAAGFGPSRTLPAARKS